ncbi:helix-turn-helix transcriptional regulator [Salmonella enterica]|nr:helix-turn-helix transcriptional regulator [Salmonella enterica]HBM0098705.1 helix-turn-helix transcriptional regulator [Salmonella enterica subsp. enterica serovar Wedding]
MLKDVLRERRTALKLKQSEVAEKIGVKPQTYMKWENGIYEPKVSYVPKIASALEITEKEICRGYLMEDENLCNIIDLIKEIEKFENLAGKTKTLVIISKYVDEKSKLINEIKREYRKERKIEQDKIETGYYENFDPDDYEVIE